MASEITKTPHRPANNTQYYYHGVSTNLKKFMSIVESGGIMSPNYLRNQNVEGLTSHVSTTGGQDLISLAVKPSTSYETYIEPGIAFVIRNSIPIVVGVRGALDGEVYARDFIPLSLIDSIYVNPVLAETKLKDIDLCALNYGSIPIEDKIRYALGSQTEDPLNCEAILGISHAMEEYHGHYTRIQQEMYDLMERQRRAPRNQKRIFRDRINEKVTELNALDLALGQSCTEAFIAELSRKFNLPNISEMTLGEFITFYLGSRQ